MDEQSSTPTEVAMSEPANEISVSTTVISTTQGDKITSTHPTLVTRNAKYSTNDQENPNNKNSGISKASSSGSSQINLLKLVKIKQKDPPESEDEIQGDSGHLYSTGDIKSFVERQPAKHFQVQGAGIQSTGVSDTKLKFNPGPFPASFVDSSLGAAEGANSKAVTNPQNNRKHSDTDIDNAVPSLPQTPEPEKNSIKTSPTPITQKFLGEPVAQPLVAYPKLTKAQSDIPTSTFPTTIHVNDGKTFPLSAESIVLQENNEKSSKTNPTPLSLSEITSTALNLPEFGHFLDPKRPPPGDVSKVEHPRSVDLGAINTTETLDSLGPDSTPAKTTTTQASTTATKLTTSTISTIQSIVPPLEQITNASVPDVAPEPFLAAKDNKTQADQNVTLIRVGVPNTMAAEDPGPVPSSQSNKAVLIAVPSVLVIMAAFGILGFFVMYKRRGRSRKRSSIYRDKRNGDIEEPIIEEPEKPALEMSSLYAQVDKSKKKKVPTATLR